MERILGFESPIFGRFAEYGIYSAFKKLSGRVDTALPHSS
jgi:hypothetical protein